MTSWPSDSRVSDRWAFSLKPAWSDPMATRTSSPGGAGAGTARSRVAVVARSTPSVASRSRVGDLGHVARSVAPHEQLDERAQQTLQLVGRDLVVCPGPAHRVGDVVV